MVTGKCKDLGRFKVPTLRGLASRAPYFHNGIAATIEDVVAFYNGHYFMEVTDQEKTDFAAFLRAL
jgi:cytochrome c peroxidase